MPVKDAWKMTWIWKIKPASDDELEPCDDDDDDEGEEEGEETLDGETAADARAADQGELEGTRLISSDLFHLQICALNGAKSLACAERWEEEVKLIKVEMIRSLRFLEYKSELWLERARQRSNLAPDIQSGVLAYAHKQSHMCKMLARKFSSHWLGLLSLNKMKQPFNWPAAYRVIRYVPTQIRRQRHRQQAHSRLAEEESSGSSNGRRQNMICICIQNV